MKRRKPKCFTLSTYTADLLEREFPRLPNFVNQSQIVERAVQELWERVRPRSRL